MALAVWNRTLVDQDGSVIPLGQIEVRVADGGALATIYRDSAGTVVESNPLTTSATGFAKFYAPSNTYSIEADNGGTSTITWLEDLIAEAETATLSQPFLQTDAQMASVTIPAGITVLVRMPSTASAGQVAPIDQYTFWRKIAGTTSTDPYFTTAGPVTWVRTGVREDEILSTFTSGISGVFNNPEIAGIKPFVNRAAFLAASISSVVDRVAWYDGGELISVVRDTAQSTGPVAQTDGTLWFPDGLAKPEHFGENTTPGTTDMTTAMNAAAATLYCELLPREYMISDLITLTGLVDEAFPEGYIFRGAGINATTILQTDPTKGHIYVEKGFGNNGPGWMTGTLGGFTLRSYKLNGVEKTDVGKAIHLERNLNSVISEIMISGPTYPIYSEGSAQCWYDKIYTRGDQRKAGENLESVYTFTDNGTSRSFGNFISNCEHQSGEDADRIFDLRAVDGLYVSNCHFNNAVKRVHIRPDNSTLQQAIYDVKFVNVYFDGGGSPEDAIYIEATLSTGTASIRIENISFTQCRFRIGSNSVLKIDTTAAGVAGLSRIEGITFTGCNFSGFEGKYFNLINTFISVPEDTIEGFQVNGGRIFDTPTPSTDNLNAFALDGKNHSIEGMTIQGDWTNAGEALIQITADCENVTVTGNTWDVPRTTVNSISASATNARVWGNTQTGKTDVVSEVVEEGTTGNGYYIKYADGRMMCRKEQVITGDTVSTAFGSLYRSGNVAIGLWAAAFNAVPVVTLSLYAAAAEGYFGLGASTIAPTATTGPTTFVFTDVSIGGATADFTVTAIAWGTWV